MPTVMFNDIRIVGISGAVPKQRVNNLIDHASISEEEKEKTIKLTGVKEYRRAAPDVCASDLCQKAAETLLEGMHVAPNTIDAVIFVTQTPDYRLPSTACVLQDKLSCSRDTVAFDVNLGCSGFVYGLYIACSFIRGGGLKRVLLLCGDAQTKLCYENDRSVNFILGDAGTATLIDGDTSAPDIRMTLKSDGSRFDKLIVPAGGFRTPSTDDTREVRIQEDGTVRSLEHLSMSGMDIFNFSVTDVVQCIREFMEENSIDVGQTDYLILHQANRFMTDKIAKKLKFPLEKVPYSLEVFGNTSCASIPLTIAYHFSRFDSPQTKKCLLSGFGVGLSWGVVDLVLNQIYCPPICEV